MIRRLFQKPDEKRKPNDFRFPFSSLKRSKTPDQHDQLSFDDLLLAILDVDAVGRDVLYPLAAEIIGGVIS